MGREQRGGRPAGGSSAHCEDSGREGTGVERLERRIVEEGRRVLVDSGSGTQSAAVLLDREDLYVPIDKERWVFSQKRG